MTIKESMELFKDLKPSIDKEALRNKYAIEDPYKIKVFSHRKKQIAANKALKLLSYLYDNNGDSSDVRSAWEYYIITMDAHKHFLDLDKAREDYKLLIEKYSDLL